VAATQNPQVDGGGCHLVLVGRFGIVVPPPELFEPDGLGSELANPLGHRKPLLGEVPHHARDEHALGGRPCSELLLRQLRCRRRSVGQESFVHVHGREDSGPCSDTRGPAVSQALHPGACPLVAPHPLRRSCPRSLEQPSARLGAHAKSEWRPPEVEIPWRPVKLHRAHEPERRDEVVYETGPRRDSWLARRSRT
jgi:hypothetical protein